MKLDRLIGILSILLQREKVTAPELAARFEVSRRDVYKRQIIDKLNNLVRLFSIGYITVQIAIIDHVAVDRVAAVPQGTADEGKVFPAVVFNGERQFHGVIRISQSCCRDLYAALIHQHGFIQGSVPVERFQCCFEMCIRDSEGGSNA